MTQPATISADYTLRPSELAATLALVCGGDKLDHGSGGICPAAGGVKLCHL